MKTGSMIAHYRVEGLLGEGGMGSVYRATDTKLGRAVAVKVLPESFAEDADRLARFSREAQVLAQLNHPNIAAIYGVERNALVLELVEGMPARGPLGLEELRAVAGQIIDALEAAHERGIVHRDLKPANVLITAGGTVKVLDFGLAKALSAPENVSPENSPTLTMGATMAGAILGTAAYMAPEQARGGRIDHRADIWAFGCVLFELATGKALFAGESVSDILAAVLRGEIPFDEAPEALRPLLRRCLERDARKRLGWIGEARGMLAPAAIEVHTAPASGTRRGWVLGAAGLLAGGGIGYWAGRGGNGGGGAAAAAVFDRRAGPGGPGAGAERRDRAGRAMAGVRGGREAVAAGHGGGDGAAGGRDGRSRGTGVGAGQPFGGVLGAGAVVAGGAALGRAAAVVPAVRISRGGISGRRAGDLRRWGEDGVPGGSGGGGRAEGAAQGAVYVEPVSGGGGGERRGDVDGRDRVPGDAGGEPGDRGDAGDRAGAGSGADGGGTVDFPERWAAADGPVFGVGAGIDGAGGGRGAGRAHAERLLYRVAGLLRDRERGDPAGDPGAEGGTGWDGGDAAARGAGRGGVAGRDGGGGFVVGTGVAGHLDSRGEPAGEAAADVGGGAGVVAAVDAGRAEADLHVRAAAGGDGGRRRDGTAGAAGGVAGTGERQRCFAGWELAAAVEDLWGGRDE